MDKVFKGAVAFAAVGFGLQCWVTVINWIATWPF
jgi:hypothetical protein